MSDITWDESYSVGIDEVDNQHKEIFTIIDEFDTAIKDKKAVDVVSNILERLVDYTSYHFKLEEELMDACKFPSCASHIELHNKLIADLNAFKVRVDTGENVSIELMHFLRKWLLYHIKNSDMSYSKHLDSTGMKKMTNWSSDASKKMDVKKKSWWNKLTS